MYIFEQLARVYQKTRPLFAAVNCRSSGSNIGNKRPIFAFDAILFWLILFRAVYVS